MTDDTDETPAGVEVPWARLDEETLRRLIAEFVTRDGTDYGSTERALDAKIADVRRQLERGEAVVVFDPASETANIVPRR